MNARELIKKLEADGWIHARTKGSHMMFQKNGMTIPVPFHGARDISTGTLRAILKQAGIK